MLAVPHEPLVEPSGAAQKTANWLNTDYLWQALPRALNAIAPLMCGINRTTLVHDQH